ncbi:MAG: hypothetical protein ACYS0D_15410, partial [Planctomycetota bacterium]
AKLEAARSVLLLERQDALIEQCDLLYDDAVSGGARSAYERAYVRYVKADCDNLSKDAEIAEVDLAYRKEVLASVRDLRENDVAPRQEVILAERNVDLARKRLGSGRLRTESCRERLERLEPARRP